MRIPFFSVNLSGIIDSLQLLLKDKNVIIANIAFEICLHKFNVKRPTDSHRLQQSEQSFFLYKVFWLAFESAAYTFKFLLANHR